MATYAPFLATLVLSVWLLTGEALTCVEVSAPATVVVDSLVTVSIPAEGILDQHLRAGTDNACVPTTLLNALRCGPPAWQAVWRALPGGDPRGRLDGLLAAFGGLPSQVDAGKPLFRDDVGVKADDIPVLFNALLVAHHQAPLSGTYLDRRDGESAVACLRRVHALLRASLAAGIPVVASIRSFAALRAPPAGGLAGDGKDGGSTPAVAPTSGQVEFSWSGIGAHVVLIVAVPRTLESWQAGFAVRYADPWIGALAEGYVRSEERRGSMAVKGSGETDFVWKDNAFLQIDAPGLDLGTSRLPWYERSFFTLNYAVGLFPDAP